MCAADRWYRCWRREGKGFPGCRSPRGKTLTALGCIIQLWFCGIKASGVHVSGVIASCESAGTALQVDTTADFRHVHSLPFGVLEDTRCFLVLHPKFLQVQCANLLATGAAPAKSRMLRRLGFVSEASDGRTGVAPMAKNSPTATAKSSASLAAYCFAFCTCLPGQQGGLWCSMYDAVRAAVTALLPNAVLSMSALLASGFTIAGE